MTHPPVQAAAPATPAPKLGLASAALLIIGSMVGSGIFLVPAEMARLLGSAPWLLAAWAVTGVITVFGALSYGELAAMMPRAGGQYVYLKEAYNPLIAFLYGWTLFAVIQTGTAAAVAVAFAKFTSVFVPALGEQSTVLALGGFRVSAAQLLAIGLLLALTAWNQRDVGKGAALQNVFTIAKVAALVALVAFGLVAGLAGAGSSAHFAPPDPAPDLTLAFIATFFAALVGSLFSSDAWNNVTFMAGEVRAPQRNLPLALLIGTGSVTALYILVNLIYVYILPIEAIASAEQDRVGTLLMRTLLGAPGALAMAGLIMVSTFGSVNGVLLSGGRVYYAMAQDRLFLPAAARLNRAGVPGAALWLQGLWASALVLTGSYGNLLNYVMFAVILFYILTVAGIFILRRRQPDAERPYRAWGYPVVPAIYLLLAGAFCATLLFHPATRGYTLFGVGIVLLGLPVYLLARRRG